MLAVKTGTVIVCPRVRPGLAHNAEVYRRHFCSVAPERDHVGGMTSSASVAYAAWAGVGDDGPPECCASARIFADIAAMKAGSPTVCKRRPIPAWITPAVWVPGGRQGAGLASPSRRAGSL